MNQPERPARGRMRPRPAADDTQDPVDYRPDIKQATADEGKGAPAPAAAPSEHVGTSRTHDSYAELPVVKREPTVQLATRVSPEIDAIITATRARTGATKRALIEEAIRRVWGA